MAADGFRRKAAWQRQAEHIEEVYENRGVPEKEAERHAWATMNKERRRQGCLNFRYHPTLEEGLKPPLRQICESVGVGIAHLNSVVPPGARSVLVRNNRNDA